MMLVLLLHVLAVREKAACAGANHQVLKAQLVDVKPVSKVRELVHLRVLVRNQRRHGVEVLDELVERDICVVSVELVEAEHDMIH